MKKHRIFNKGDQIHCFLTSYNHPKIFLPVKAIIKETQWDTVNPRYLVKVLKFYDSYIFLKNTLFEMNFSNSFDKRAQPLSLKSEDYKRNRDLESVMVSEDPRYFIVVDSVLAVKTYNDLSDLFNQLQFFLISRELSDLKTMMTRTIYKGPFKIDTEREFKIRLKNTFGDRDVNFDIDKFLDSL
jgi:hypothetical protein